MIFMIFCDFLLVFGDFRSMEPSQKQLHKSDQKTSNTDLQKGGVLAVLRTPSSLKIDPGLV